MISNLNFKSPELFGSVVFRPDFNGIAEVPTLNS